VTGEEIVAAHDFAQLLYTTFRASPEQLQEVAAAKNEMLRPFDHLSLKGPSVPHLTISVDNLKTTPPPSADVHGSSGTVPFTPNHTGGNYHSIAPNIIQQWHGTGQITFSPTVDGQLPSFLTTPDDLAGNGHFWWRTQP
jgi:hypothetical protein